MAVFDPLRAYRANTSALMKVDFLSRSKSAESENPRGSWHLHPPQPVLIIDYVEDTARASPAPQNDVQAALGCTLCETARQQTCEAVGDEPMNEILCRNRATVEHSCTPAGICQSLR